MPKSRLVELFAQHLGVIEEARVSFGPQFNVITGETGAGKTLLLGALELSLGGDHASSRYAVTSESRAAALFDVDGQEQVFVRESTPSGRLRSSLDGAPTSADVLRERASELIVIHGQHDSLTLRNRAEVVKLIDTAGGIDTSTLNRIRAELRELISLRDASGGDSASRLRDLDFLRFQSQEIEDVAVADEGELTRSLEELASITELIESQAAIDAVCEGIDGDHEGAALATFSTFLRHIPSGAAFADVRTTLKDALEMARDAVRDLRALSDPDAIDAERLAALQLRVEILQSLVRKYGPTLGDVIAHGRSVRAQADALSESLERLEGLDAEIGALKDREREESMRIRKEREFAAVGLSNRLRDQLPRVALPHATLRFDVDGLDGSDSQILFTPNPGQPEGPLQSLASGGELSRVLLALSLVSDQEHLVAVFDEVDAGIGGQVAQQIGSCLAEVGERQQVIAVTHLPSVAARAQHHFVIQKVVTNGVTRTTISEVQGAYRVREIARMLAGDSVTEEAVALAQRLLTAAQ